MNEITSLLLKVLDRAKSSRVWAVAGGNVVGLTMIEGDWPRAAVIAAVNVAYVVSETVLKLWGKPASPPKPTRGSRGA